MTFAAKVNELLAEQERSQRWLARNSGVNITTVNRLLNGGNIRIKMQTAERIVNVVGRTRRERKALLLLAAGIK